ncbi:MAG: hypothetical protein HGA71_12665 [Azonexaceae bacterium]|nr:hypothetical protein [Azonexaceae bacterium]
MSAANNTHGGHRALSEDAFNSDAAEVVLGAIEPETLAAKHGVSVESAIELIGANETDISRVVAEMVSDGRDVALMAKKGLSSALRQLASQIEGEQLSPALLLRTVEVLNKVSGLEAKQKAQPEQQSSFSITIILPKENGRAEEIVIGKPDVAVIEGDSREVGDDD